MLPALAAYINAIHKLTSIFFELAFDTNIIGEKLDGVKELLDDDEESEKKVRRYYGRMFAVSQRLNSSLIGTVHIFNITTATVFATSSQF